MEFSPLQQYLLHLADSSLIMSQRLGEWTGHGPVLEQDIAITNIALDQLGQARHWYQLVATLHPTHTSEDELAYLRDAIDFRNHTMLELPNGDWAQSILKIFFFACWQKLLYSQLLQHEHAQVAAIAEKSLKEIEYHLRWSSEWVIRLSDSTQESRKRMMNALAALQPYLPALLKSPTYQPETLDTRTVEANWFARVADVFAEATLDELKMPKASYQGAGWDGVHTEHLGYLLAEMQYLQRAYPNSAW